MLRYIYATHVNDANKATIFQIKTFKKLKRNDITNVLSQKKHVICRKGVFSWPHIRAKKTLALCTVPQSKYR